MRLRVRNLVNPVLSRFNTKLISLRTKDKRPVYDQDGLTTCHNHDFLLDERFGRAYARGVKANGDDPTVHWRIHVGLWVARCAARLEADFVECGVNRGFLSSAIMEWLDWNSYPHDFYLLDTFGGLDARFISDEERARGILKSNEKYLLEGHYVSGADSVRKNFSEWNRVHIIEGAIPETLEQVTSTRIGYLHIDLNCAPPELAAARYFWPRLVPGAFVLLDDYAYVGFESQKRSMDAFASEHNLQILSLPTGQGLMVKPSSVDIRQDTPTPTASIAAS